MQGQSGTIDDNYDVIVVGAGIGGCIMAARLAQVGVNPQNGEKLKIALFEWGPYHKGDPKRGYGIPSRRASFDGMPYELARRFMTPWGELGMVGGSTQWAGMIAIMPEPIDFLTWQAETGVDWTMENFTYPLTETREMWHPEPEPEEVRSPGQQKFRDTALSLGYRVTEVGQAKLNCPRCGDCNGRICRYDAKSTGLVTYAPIADHEGVHILPQTPVEKVIIEKKGSRPVATGVVYRKDGKPFRARADKVILSCGWNATPVLLYQSGYGPRDKVRGELIAENRHVGAHVRAGVAGLGVQALFDEAVKRPDIGVHGVYTIWKALDPRGYNTLIIREDFGSREGTGRYPSELAASRLAPAMGRDLKEYMAKCLTHVGSMNMQVTKNRVEGEINLQGGIVIKSRETAGERSATDDRPGTEDEVPRSLLEKDCPEVIELLREGQAIAKKIVSQMGARKIATDDELPDRFGFSLPTSSCRAGASRDNSVVNSDLESHDVDNLFICDSSVLPCQGGGNLSMPTAAICCYAWRRMVINHFSRA